MIALARRGALVGAAMLAVACSSGALLRSESAPQATPCPPAVPAGTRCLAGLDSSGAYHLIAIPAGWAGDLVLHAHGGPTLGPPKAGRSVEDLQRWAIMVKAGYAWAGSTFRQGGVEVRAAAEDTERVRRIFVQHVGVPRRTILHGQSWGAAVAAKAAEMFGGDGTGRRPYDALLLTSGVLAGGTRAYDVRLDLRVVYQYLCANHPRSDETQYPLSIGLPTGVQLTQADLAARADACLGLRLSPAARTAEQRRKLKTLVDVLRIPERSVLSHLNWATWHFQDIASNRTGGASPFGNIGVRYTGSDDDDALNAGVQRFRADPAAQARFARDTDPSGRIAVPVLTAHGIGDPIAFVEMEAEFRATMERAGTADRLVQTFTDHNEHSYLSDAVYVTLVSSLIEWAAGGGKPTPATIARRCVALEARYGPGCRFVPDYTPASLEKRVPRREQS